MKDSRYHANQNYATIKLEGISKSFDSKGPVYNKITQQKVF